jgi:alpha-tubulin suppressor-like RCC1 family protein
MLSKRWAHGGALVLAVSLAACAGPGEEDVGSAQIAVANIPADGSVRCIQVTATGGFTTSRSQDVTPGQITTLHLTGLPVGTVRFDGSAYATTCAAVAPSDPPTWISDPVIATVSTGQPAAVALHMHQNGNASVSVDFPDAGCLGDGAPCLAGGECCSQYCAPGNTCQPAGSSSSSSSSSGGAARPNGELCTAASQCQSGFCVDGFCCDSACTDACHACSADHTGGTSGTCGPVTNGSYDPRGQCTAMAAPTCGTDGNCQDGACRYWLAGTFCSLASCSGGTQTTAGVCDGAGTCSGTTTSCAPYACDAVACKASCANDGDCAATAYCAGATCVPRQANGAPCAASDQCASGFCADGVCCDTACAGACQACSSALTGGPDGTCSNVTDGAADPHGSCGATDPSSCGTDGHCSAGACRYWAAGTSCGAGCFSGTAISSTCDGAGTCQPATPVACEAGAFCWLAACVKAEAVSAGYLHSCALTTAGGVQCWGYGLWGQLGNGDVGIWSPTPLAVSGLSSGVAAIDTGYGHTCALTSAGGVLCWGASSNGQLGNGATADSGVPVAVAGLSSGATAIATGDNHTCALTSAGSVLCWGSITRGQLGNDATWPYDSGMPVAVSGLSSGVTAIAAGGDHTCALTSAGSVLCWGANEFGQLGNGSTTDSHVPVAVSGLSSGVTAIAAGLYHTCARIADGSVQCWGYNASGQLGNGSTFPYNNPVPVTVSGLSSGAAAVTGGGCHTCALLTTGGVECWGCNGLGNLGNGSTTDSPVPVPVSGLSSGVTDVEAGNNHSCVVTSAGRIQCWGYNWAGQLGNNTATDSPVPVDVVEP